MAGRGVARGIAAVLLGLAALLGSYVPAQAQPVPQASSCAGIWVVVDYAALGGGTVTGCATTYTTGTTALRNAGFPGVVLDAGMIVKINWLPTSPNTAQNYWSYWHATRQADGSYSAWSYSSLGANAFQPGPNDAEGWRYEPTNGAYVPPSVLPPKQVTATQAPATTAPAPATTARTTAAPKRTTTTAPAATTTTAAAAASTSASQAVSDSPTPSASDSASLSDTPSDTPTSTPGASSSPSPGANTGAATRSLLGGLGAIGAIAAGAGGVLWWRKRGLPGG